MKDMTLNKDQSSLTRRQLLGLATLTTAGSAKESTVKQLPVATSIAGVSMRLKPGGLRELHYILPGKVPPPEQEPLRQANGSRLGKQPTDLRRHHYMRDGALVSWI
jgi:hypothetical protein